MKTVELQDIKRRYNIVGNCDALNHALDVAIQVASTDLSVLIEGESGVGRRLFHVSFTIYHHVIMNVTSQSTAALYQKALSIPNCSDTKRALSPVQ